jgi:methylmalonyl-CoA mutase cobalamin-binding subunit
LTGLPAATIRSWERLHRVVVPQRDGRDLVYTGSDVKRLQLLAAAVERGHTIQTIARLADVDLELLIAGRASRRATIHAVPPDDEIFKAVLMALSRFDAAGVERELDRLSTALEPRDFVRRVAQFMRRVGDEFAAERLGIAQEHLLSAAIRSQLGGMMKRFRREDAAKRLLFATPPGERHELGLLAAAMLAAAGGFGVVYIGADVPSRQIVDSAARSGVDIVVLGSMYSAAARDLRKHVDYLIDRLPGRVELWVGGVVPSGVDQEISGRAIVRVADFDVFERELVRMGGRF